MNRTNMVRGAFGHMLRQVCCVPECQNPRRCHLASECPYKQIFEPSPPPNSASLSKNQDIPRPFVFRAQDNGPTCLAPGEEFDFDLVLIGRTIDFLSYFVLCFQQLGAQGFGLNRARCELKRVEELCDASASGALGNLDSIFDTEGQVLHLPRGIDLEHWIMQRMAPLLKITKISIRFLSPTLLKAENRVMRQPDFHHVFKRLRDRINALSTFFGTGSLDVDFAGLGRRAERIRTARSHLQWAKQYRISSKTQQQHQLSGFVGDIFYEGDIDEFLPWLLLGELIHVGKHTAWGMGRFEIQPFPE